MPKPSIVGDGGIVPAGRIGITLRSNDPAEGISARTVADRLNALQAALIHIGDYLTGSDVPQRGGSPTAVRKKCTLFIASVSLGSFTAELEVPPQPLAPDGDPGLGEASIAKLKEIVLEIEQSPDAASGIETYLTDRRHRARILGDLLNVWPDDGEKLTVEMKLPGVDSAPLSPTWRLALQGRIMRQPPAEQTSVKGILGTAHVTPGAPYIRRTGPDGRIT